MKIRAFYRILFSVLLISGTAWSAFGVYFYYRYLRLKDENYTIEAIVQAHSKTEALKSSFLAELLELSINYPTNLYHFDIKKAEKRLLSCPLIKKVKIQRIPPRALYVEYMERKPIAYLADFTNSCIDEEGYLMPFKPFFSPKRLPQIYFGLERDLAWGSQLKEEEISFGLQVLKAVDFWLGDQEFRIAKIDLSQVFTTNLGRKKITLVLEEIETAQEKTLLLFPSLLEDGLKRFKLLLPQLAVNDSVLIDLRLKNLAFIHILNDSRP